jgi:transposase
LARATTTAFPP